MSPLEEKPRPRLRERIEELERHMLVMVALNDALKSLLIGLTASLSVTIPDWSDRLRRLCAVTSQIVDNLEYSEEFRDPEELRAMTIAIASSAFQEIGMAMTDYERAHCAGEA